MLLRDRVRRTPDARAVVTCTGEVFTYAGIRDRSSRVARYLVDGGVRPSELVAVLARKGWEQVVACFGVLMSGAAYVPVDPGWPAARIEGILEQTGARFVLTQSSVSLPPSEARAAFNVDVQWTKHEPLAAESDAGRRATPTET